MNLILSFKHYTCLCHPKGIIRDLQLAHVNVVEIIIDTTLQDSWLSIAFKKKILSKLGD